MSLLRSLLLGLAVAAVTYGGVVGITHLSGRGAAELSTGATQSVTPTLAPENGAKNSAKQNGTTLAQVVAPKLAQLSPTLAPTGTVTPSPRISPTPWPSTPTPTPSPTSTPTHHTASPTPWPTQTVTPSPTPTPSDIPTPSPEPTETPNQSPTPEPTDTPAPSRVVINEIAWMGTAADANDEWLELYNAGDSAVDLSGWTLQAEDGTPKIALSGTIGANGYYLLERTDDTVISDIAADQIYSGAMGNAGEVLVLRDSTGTERDRVSAWYAGNNTTKASMERIDALADGSDPSNWADHVGAAYGADADGNPINGTPGAKNSVQA